jgi:hypothetical protein
MHQVPLEDEPDTEDYPPPKGFFCLFGSAAEQHEKDDEAQKKAEQRKERLRKRKLSRPIN